MNVFEKMRIKSKFNKYIVGHPDRKSERWEDFIIFYFTGIVINAIQDFENKLNDSLNALFLEFNKKVKIDRNDSDKNCLVFYNESCPSEIYQLIKDHVSGISIEADSEFVKTINENKSQLESIYNFLLK